MQCRYSKRKILAGLGVGGVSLDKRRSDVVNIGISSL
jgi:hypothetical protein